MKNNVLFTVFYFIISASAFGAGFEKRWFWFYSASEEMHYVVITYDPENDDRCSISSIDGGDISYQRNPFSSLVVDRNIVDWPGLFDIAEKTRKGELSIGFSFTVPGDDPLLSHIVKSQTAFKVKSSAIYSKFKNYHKVVFEGENGATIVVYLEKINESEYRVSAIFLKSEGGNKYSYRDYSFKKDFNDGGNAGASGMAVNFLHYQSPPRYKMHLENRLNDNLVGNRKSLTVPLMLLSELFIITSWKISVTEN